MLTQMLSLRGNWMQDDKLFDKKLEEFGVDEKYAEELAREEEEEIEEEDEREHDGQKQGW